MVETKEVKQLVKKRASIKSRLTIFANFIVELQDKIETVNDLADLDLIQLKRRLTIVEPIISEFSEIQDSIESVAENLADEFAERESFERIYHKQTSIATSIINKFNKDLDNNETLSNKTRNNPRSTTLPEMPIPKFNGDIKKWLEFREKFMSLIHKNEDIDNVEKFHYLIESLEGSAPGVIESIDFTAENYDIAWQALCDRFNNKRLLLHNHVKEICEAEQIIKVSPDKIRNLIDTINKHLKTLEHLGQPVHSWDTLLIYIIEKKFDRVTLNEWQKYRFTNEVPTMTNLREFLKGRADLLETSEHNRDDKQFKRHNTTKAFFSKTIKCGICKDNHFIYQCPDFKKFTVEDRRQRIRTLKLCFNCLRGGHAANACQSGGCRVCNLKHNTALHQGRETSESSDRQTDGAPTTTQTKADVAVHTTSNAYRQVLLATAQILIFDKFNRVHTARVLLDSGSQSSFITSELCDKLQISKEKINLSITGLNHVISETQFKCNLKIKSRICDFKTQVTCLVLPVITGDLPNAVVNVSALNIPKHCKLADPQFHYPGKIDMLIGADLYWNLIGAQQTSLGKNMPVMRESKLGWVISGPIASQFCTKTFCNFSKTIQDQIARFWEIEEGFLEKRVFSVEERECEEHFVRNTKRDKDGRFIVSVPFKEPPSKLGESRQLAEKRFLTLERKLQSNSSLKREYVNFMQEYKELGHMSAVKKPDDAPITYYMPHHGVIREDSLTTKLRVVFDASALSTSGYSSNNLQMVGPTIQEDLISIILRFRKHRYVIAADIAKMYRQVLVETSQRPLQRILWRSEPKEPLIAYNLNTVTYGTASASFLAIRSVLELAKEIKDSEPEIAQIIERDFYADDLLSGGSSVEEVTRIAQRVTTVLETGCFELRKWHSNDTRILKNLDTENSALKIVNLSENENAKTLGLLWNCHSDNFMYDVKMIDSKVITKRTVLSEIAQIFDPLGLLSVCTINAKMLLQKLWLLKLTWDEPLPDELKSFWLRLVKELPCLNKLRIPRNVICNEAVDIQVHGFSDASMNAYGGCIYVRSAKPNGEVYVHLLCSKGKVAPLKPVTIPRLELCGALTLARLMNKVKQSLNLKSETKYTFWTDSTVVLGWLKATPNSLNQFAGNRVSEIQQLTHADVWRHVPTKENPADMLSRGISPSQALDLKIWFNGPKWLAEDEGQWPSLKYVQEKLPELRNETRSFAIKNPEESLFFSKFSSLIKLKRVTAFVLRFIENSKRKRESRQVGPLTFNETNRAFFKLVQLSQSESFGTEINLLKSKKPLSKRSNIIKLSPFLSSDQLLRVGGRLENSKFKFDKKHPLILSSSHNLTKLIFRYEHIKLFHAGPQLLLANIRERIWPIQGRNLAKKTVHECISCFRARPVCIQPRMGNLPEARVLPGYPFAVTGIDYAGPIMTKDRKGRGCKLLKSYLALFVCFSTKAIHLELVTDLSKECFLLALNRFIARRGKPARIYSDNGTNFTGAYAEIKRVRNFLRENTQSISDAMIENDLQWEFIPPYSPHFGGLWEAGVKSAKSHLKRVVGNSHFTFEELYTLLTQIESILNSRPLYPLSSHPNDLNPLTPAHFLIGRHPASLPTEDLSEIPASRVKTKYQHLQQLAQHFWARWHKEYVSELQHRSKWLTSHGTLNIGDLVLIKDDNLPPLQWRLGRITEVHPGKDGITRVATINTARGPTKRSFSKLCPLPRNKDVTC